MIIVLASVVSQPQLIGWIGKPDAREHAIESTTYAPAMTERMIKSGDVDICTEAFGDESDTPILLIMGASASMLMWPEELLRTACGGRSLRHPLRQP